MLTESALGRFPIDSKIALKTIPHKAPTSYGVLHLFHSQSWVEILRFYNTNHDEDNPTQGPTSWCCRDSI